MKNIRPVSRVRLEKCLNGLGNSNQSKAVLRYIWENPQCLTSQIAREAGAINIPQIVKMLRPHCLRYGIEIVNYLPDQRPNTRHGTKSMQHRWYVSLNG